MSKLDELKKRVKFDSAKLPKLERATVEAMLDRRGLSILYADSCLSNCRDEEEVRAYIQEIIYHAATNCKHCYGYGCRICLE